MPVVFAIVLGLVQALTEFLPVSSSGHLVIFQHYLAPLMGAAPPPLAFDVFVHTATLLATVVYLRRDILGILGGLFGSGPEGQRARSLALLIILGSVPAAAVGLGLKDLVEEAFHSKNVAAIGFLITSAFLLLAHRKQLSSPGPDDDGSAESQLSSLDWVIPSLGAALLIGAAQALAITPGISRSGSTIAAALLLGLPAISAIRFSFLLSLPAIGGATLLEGKHLLDLPSTDITAYGAGFCASFFAGLLAIRMLVRVTKNSRLIYFAAYTAALSLLVAVV
ncbi:MAG: undecaprenyl-diphosphate phosphatase [Bdellovibrionales bacterium]|nr:undecaprenyl-diphosphate phosphatase [Bdellovibrionales bacterium]